MEKLNKEFLQRNQLPEEIIAPGTNWDNIPEKVLQFGTGVLLRGLPGYLIDKANRKGEFNGRIVVVKSTDKGSTDDFAKQDNLYTVHTRGIENGKEVQSTTIVSSISRVLSATSQWNEILSVAQSDDLKIVISNTTEVGIALDATDNLAANPPSSFPGKLTSLLYSRFLYFKGNVSKGLTILPTELINDNGLQLKRIVVKLAELNNFGKEFLEWLDLANHFCNTLVDRIVPGILSKEEQELANDRLGYVDSLAIMAEPFRLWAIEVRDEEVINSLSFAKADEGVILTPDIYKYKELKLRLLNGSHSFLCGLAISSGFVTVKELMADAGFSSYLKRLMDEIGEAVEGKAVTKAEAQSFADKVVDRFRNPSLNHHWASISLNYTDKMQTRNVPLIRSYIEKKGTVPVHMALGFAAYLVLYKDRTIENDPYAPILSAKWKIHDTDLFVDEILGNQTIWKTDLSLLPGFAEAVKGYCKSLIKNDTQTVIKSLNQKSPTMKHRVLKVHRKDNVLVALQDLYSGETVDYNGESYLLKEDIPAKHKFFTKDLKEGDPVIMYGTLVGRVQFDLEKCTRMSTENIKHAAAEYHYRPYQYSWDQPDVSKFKDRTFNGYHRKNGEVGTANHWLFIPMVFCENRNLDVIREALHNELGYTVTDKYKAKTQLLRELYEAGEDVKNADLTIKESLVPVNRLFKNVDGIKFLNHQGGCGGIRQDASVLSKLLAAYADHPNVAGITVMSLGCQNLQVKDFLNDLKDRNPNFDKPTHIFEQQQSLSEEELITSAIKETFLSLIEVNKITRQPAPLHKLTIGVKCGGSDGFSGISANPAVGYCSDLLVTLGGKILLAEFPELCGAEQNIIDRIEDEHAAKKFISLMSAYSDSAERVGSGFHMNPSPGNIKDGLITDAIKSNGAVKKGGVAPIVDVLDYTEPAQKPGLNLVCTPGNDVEATTGKAASGATLILFTTGLGTPTGNPICPVIKVSSNTALTKRMRDIIDIDCGPIISGDKTIEEMGEEILEYCIKAASGEIIPHAVRLNQDDFIPWKRGVSL